MDVIFKTRIHVCHYGLTFSSSVLFLDVALSDSGCIFTSKTSSTHCNSFSMLIIHLPLSVIFSLFPYFTPKLFAPFASDCWFVLGILHQLVGRIFFHNFGISSFVCIALSCPVIFLVFFLLPITFDLSLPVVISDLSSVLFWLFHPNISLHVFLSLVHFVVVTVSLSVFLV